MAHWFSVSVLHLQEYRTVKEQGGEVKRTSSRNLNKENNSDTDGKRGLEKRTKMSEPN